jgi:hypothetical protein
VSHEDDETPSPDGADDIAANIRALQYYPYSEHFRKSYYGVPKMHVGSVALEPLNSLPIDVSVRNAQLLHFCERFQNLKMSRLLMDSSHPKAGSFHVVD